MKRSALLKRSAGCLAVLSLALAMGSSAVLAEDTPYTVVCEGGACKVDKITYIGWRTYHSNCHVCHAQDAIGSTFAPSLVDKMKEIDKERFMLVLNDGYTGQIGVMPGWKDNPNVNKRFEDLYAYLKARSDGVLGPGKPARIK